MAGYKILGDQKILFIYFYREGKGGRKRERGTSCVVASQAPPTGHLACDPGMGPAWELKQQSFASQSQSITQPIEPHQPGPKQFLKGGTESIVIKEILMILIMLHSFLKTP